jgi:DNA-binding MarR family transcriptional regulator
LRRAARAITKIYDKALAPSNLKATQFAALMYIKDHGPLNISTLSTIMVLDRTTLVRNLKHLENAVLIENVPTSDSRERQINITEDGRRAVELAFPHWKQVQREMVNKIGSDNLKTLDFIVTIVESVLLDNGELTAGKTE